MLYFVFFLPDDWLISGAVEVIRGGGGVLLFPSWGCWAGVLSPPYFWEVTQTCMFMRKMYWSMHFCSNLIKIRAILLVLNSDVCVTLPVLRTWERGLRGRTKGQESVKSEFSILQNRYYFDFLRVDPNSSGGCVHHICCTQWRTLIGSGKDRIISLDPCQKLGWIRIQQKTFKKEN